jgi:hypothetical protein
VISKYGIKTTRKDWLIFQKLSKRLSIDDGSSNGELYTILTNKAKGKKTIVAMIAGINRLS